MKRLPQQDMNGCPSCAESSRRHSLKIRTETGARVPAGKRLEPTPDAMVGFRTPPGTRVVQGANRELQICGDTGCRPMTKEEKRSYLLSRAQRKSRVQRKS